MPVVDAMLAPATQARQRLHYLLPVPHLQPLGVHTHLDLFANQPARHRVGIAAHVDRAAPVHPHPQPSARFQSPHRQRSQQRHLLGQTLLTTRITLAE
jgi:hypothetical protein